MAESLDRVVTFRQGGDALGQTEDVTTRLGTHCATAGRAPERTGTSGDRAFDASLTLTERKEEYIYGLIHTSTVNKITKQHNNHIELTICFKWSPQTDSNRRPSDYKSDALPAELCGRAG